MLTKNLRNSRAPWLCRRYPASQLLRTHPPPSRLQSISRCYRLYDLPCANNFLPGRGGLLQLLSIPLSPCRRYYPAGAGIPPQPACGIPCCLHLYTEGSTSGVLTFRGHLCVHFRCGPGTRSLPLR
jgi:hypothetical protein